MHSKNKKGIKNFILETKNLVFSKFKKYLSTNILFLTYLLTSVLIGLILRGITLGNVFSFKPFICDVIVVSIFGSFGYLFKPKNQFKYFFTLSVIYTILCIINNIYYTFYSGFISVSLINTLSMFGEVSDSVTTKLKLYYFVYLLAPIIMVIVHLRLSKRQYYFNVGKYEKGKKMFACTVVGALFISLIVATTLTRAEASRIVKLWNRDYVVKKFGIYMYTVNDFVQSIYPTISPMFGYEQASITFNNFYSESKNKTTNNYTNIFEGKNVIFIHGESIQNFLINLKINDIEITPNLNKLASEGMYFTNFYPQISVGTSSDSEFTLSTGLIPSSAGTVFVNYYDRKYETIQNAFKEKGYFTFSAHANAATYWNRQEMYKTLGYDKFYAKDSFIIPEDDESEDIVGLGLSDKSFYEQLMPILKEVKDSSEPFMGTIISLSNHSPFNDVDKYGDLDFSIYVDKLVTDSLGNSYYEQELVPYLENTEIGNYLKSAHYADEAYGLLFELLEENGLLDNTVIVFYGDHESKIGKNNLNYLFNYDPYTDQIKSKDDPTYISLDNYRYDLLKNTPFIIWTKDDRIKEKVNDIMGMWDVYPTIANMFNLSCNYALGNDIFSDNEKIVVFPNGDVLTNKVFFNNLKEEYILLTDEAIDNEYMTEYINRLKEYADVRLNVSKSIIVYNLLEKKEEKKNEK